MNLNLLIIIVQIIIMKDIIEVGDIIKIQIKLLNQMIMMKMIIVNVQEVLITLDIMDQLNQHIMLLFQNKMIKYQVKLLLKMKVK